MKFVILLATILLGTLMPELAKAALADAQVINFLPVASVTTSGDSTAADMVLYSGPCVFQLDVSAPVSGDSTGLAVKLTNSATSGGVYTDVTGGGFTAVAASASSQKLVLNKDKLKRFVKLNRVITGTGTPTYLVSSKGYCEKRRK